MKKINILVGFLLSLMLILAACSGEGSIQIESELELEIGKTFKIEAIVKDLDATELLWSSDNTSVATVDGSGKVTAIAIGQAVIRAEINSVFATCRLTVIPATVTQQELLQNAKQAKIESLPSLSSFDQNKYTVDSWGSFSAAIDFDIASINALTTVEDVQAYSITAQTSLLVTKLDAAKQAMLLTIPSLSEYSQIDYTQESWELFSEAIQIDILAVNACDTLEKVQSYIVTADVSLLVTKLDYAKAVKLLDVPSINSYTEGDYEPQSWQEFSDAINADIAAINACSTVAQVELYVITANEDILIKLDARAEIEIYISGWVQSNLEHPWTGELGYEAFLEALEIFQTIANTAETEVEIAVAAAAFKNTPNMSLRKAKEDAKNEIREIFFVQESQFMSYYDNYWTYVQNGYFQNLSLIDTATTVDGTDGNINDIKATAIATFEETLLNSIKTPLVGTINAYVDSLNQNLYFPDKWLELISLAEVHKDDIRNSTTVEQAIQMRDSVLQIINSVPKKMDAIISIIDQIEHGQISSTLVNDTYNALLMLSADADMLNSINNDHPNAIQSLSSYLSDHVSSAAEARILQLITSVFSDRLGTIPASFSSAVSAVKTLMLTQQHLELDRLIVDIKSDLAAFDKNVDPIGFIGGFENRLNSYKQELWSINWIDDYILNVTIDLDGGQIEGLDSQDLVFSIRIRYANDAYEWRIDSLMDVDYQRLLSLNAPQKEGFSFVNWQMQNEWYLYTITSGENIIGAEWRKWDDEIWLEEEGVTKSYLSPIDFSKISAGRFVSRINGVVYVYPELSICFTATWKTTGGGVSGPELPFVGTWECINDFMRYVLEIGSDGKVRDYYYFNDFLMPTVEYTYVMDGDIMILSADGRIDIYLRINNDEGLEYDSTRDFNSVGFRSYTKVL